MALVSDEYPPFRSPLSFTPSLSEVEDDEGEDSAEDDISEGRFSSYFIYFFVYQWLKG